MCMCACLSVLINTCSLHGKVLLRLLMFTYVSEERLQVEYGMKTLGFEHM